LFTVLSTPEPWVVQALYALSFLAPLVATFLLTRGREKRSFIFIAALAIVCFVLFSWLALPGFFIGLGAAALERARKLEQHGKTLESEAKARKKRREAKRDARKARR